MNKKSLTQEEVESRLRRIGYEAAGEYRGLRVKMLVHCPRHNFTKAVGVNNLFQGGKMACCSSTRVAVLTPDELLERFSSRGYTLLSEYKNVNTRVLLRCEKHGVEKLTFPGNIFAGGSMACCGKESMREKHRINNTGEKNPFFGKSHSIQTRDLLSRQRIGKPTNKPMPPNVKKALVEANTGKPRSEETKRKLREHMARRSGLFSYCVRKAKDGKTAGKQGIFYVVRVGDLLKFGSATTTMAYRLARLRQKHGDDVELKMYALVDDAGAYEAAMMERFESYWVKGEYFRDFTALA